ncbi:MAG: hypothetical protein AAFX99_13775, partial [Myxococcota bacterium]
MYLSTSPFHPCPLPLVLALVVIASTACDSNYRPSGQLGAPCTADGSCNAELRCVAFVCVEGDGTYDAGIRPDAQADTPPGPADADLSRDTDRPSDTDRPNDTAIAPDTDRPPPPPDTTPPPPDTPRVCTPMERRCLNERTEQICTPDGTRFVSRSCDASSSCTQERCRPDMPFCEPGTVFCDGNRIVRCRPDGQGIMIGTLVITRSTAGIETDFIVGTVAFDHD